MEIKSYKLDFFQVDIKPKKKEATITLGDILDDQIVAAEDSSLNVRGEDYELRDLGYMGSTKDVIRGVFGRFRRSDLPHAAAPGAAERRLNLADEEGLLEKNHFIYVRQHRILVYQRNRNASGITRFYRYLTDKLGNVVTCNPILQAHAIKKLMNHQSDITEIDITIARASNPELYKNQDRPNWGNNSLDMLSSTGAHKIRFVIKGNGHAKDQGKFLEKRILAPLKNIMTHLTVSRARVKWQPEDDDDPGFVDLLKDRITSVVDVQSNDRYPISDDMWRASYKAWRDQRAAIEEVVGNDTEVSD